MAADDGEYWTCVNAKRRTAAEALRPKPLWKVVAAVEMLGRYLKLGAPWSGCALGLCRADLAELAAGRKHGRGSADELVIFDSTGSGVRFDLSAGG